MKALRKSSGTTEFPEADEPGEPDNAKDDWLRLCCRRRWHRARRRSREGSCGMGPGDGGGLCAAGGVGGAV